jgi:hypothetical protein
VIRSGGRIGFTPRHGRVRRVRRRAHAANR